MSAPEASKEALLARPSHPDNHPCLVAPSVGIAKGTAIVVTNVFNTSRPPPPSPDPLVPVAPLGVAPFAFPIIVVLVLMTVISVPLAEWTYAAAIAA